MDVVNSAADLQRVRVNLVEYSGKVILEPRGNVGVKHRRPVSRAEDEMNV
jgi:hypothetical protein